MIVSFFIIFIIYVAALAVNNYNIVISIYKLYEKQNNN